MLKKFGDLNPITIIDPVDVSTASTKKSLKKAIKSVKDIQNKEKLSPPNKVSETK